MKRLWMGTGALALQATVAHALPVGMLLEEAGTQSDVEWRTLESPHIRVYHDEKALPLARFVLRTQEEAWDGLARLWDFRLRGEKREAGLESRFERIPLVLSTRTHTGGFANFATMNLELQTGTGSPGALYEHELVHRLMYEHLDPGVGPAGRAFTLAMVPTWWIEGVAEALTESVGRLETLGVARTMALNDRWLSWDSMHALYHSGSGDAHRGYVSAGRFVRYLFRQKPAADVPSLHADYFWKTLTPPFVNASSRFVHKFWGRSDLDMWNEYKAWELKYWREELAGMPSLLPEGARPWLLSPFPRSFQLSEGKLVHSGLHGKPWPSALLSVDLKTGEDARAPLDLEGGALFATSAAGTFWTVRRDSFANGAAGHQLVHAGLNGPLGKVQGGDGLDEGQVLRISTGADPLWIEDLRPAGTRALAVGNLRGEILLLLADAATGKVTALRRWDPPVSVRIVGTGEQDGRGCADLLIDEDKERTGLIRFCEGMADQVLLEPGRLVIRDAVRQADGSLMLLVGWHEVLGLLEMRDGKAVAGAPLPEWVADIEPMGEGLGAWVYNGYGYELYQISPKAFFERSQRWSSRLAAGNKWLALPGRHQHVRPWAAMLRERGLPESSAPAQDGQAEPVPAFVPGDAPFRNRHFFTYPYGTFPGIGGWSLGLFTIPLMDEIERYRLSVAFSHNFDTGMPAVSANFTTFRVWDGLSFEASYGPRFNGYYYRAYDRVQTPEGERWALHYARQEEGEVAVRDVNYLREVRAGVSLTKALRPVTLIGTVDLVRLELWDDEFGEREAHFLGAQRVPALGTASLTLATTLADWGFYLGDETEPGGNSLRWRTTAQLRGATTHSVGPRPETGLGYELAPLNFHRTSASLKSSFLLNAHEVALRGMVSSTLGPRPLNLREIYQPYQTYLMGSSQGLNNLSFALYNDGNLFGIRQGEHAFKLSCDYGFPIWSNIDWKFLIAYLDSIRGELVLAHGGVAHDKSFKDLESLTSASMAARMTIDIKGFKLFPSLAYGQVLGSRDKAFFSELSFSEFF